eukprot:9472107-Pyramimonas_sp.AAC.1
MLNGNTTSHNSMWNSMLTKSMLQLLENSSRSSVGRERGRGTSVEGSGSDGGARVSREVERSRGSALSESVLYRVDPSRSVHPSTL